MKRTGITLHTVAQLQALSTIIPQLGDEVMISDLAHAVFKYIPVSGTDDAVNVIVQNDGTNNHTWVRVGLNLVDAFDVAYTAVPDNASDVFEATATGLKRDGAYVVALVSGAPANAAGDVASYARVRPSADNKLAVEISNNTGGALVAGTLRLNVFQIGG